MAVTLHTLPKTRGRKKRRLGRGSGSGRGTYAARGLKGQRARSGGRKGILRRGAMQTIAKLPKTRGFTSNRLPYAVVTLGWLEQHCEEGMSVTPTVFAHKGVHLTKKRGVKVLGNGTLTKKLTVRAHAFSESAKHGITKTGGEAITL